MSEFLIADIGGTNSRLAFVGPDGRPARMIEIANDSVAGPEDLIGRALANAGEHPQRAVIALAGPIINGDEVVLTNRAWRFRLSELSARCGLARIHVLNDFEAIAWSLPLLGDADVQAIGPDLKPGLGVKAVVGPGTGLGVAALLPTPNGWHPVASEGGHASFGPVAADEEALFRNMRDGGGSMSAEMVLSGRGLARLHGAMHPGILNVRPEMIVTQARAGDRDARATVVMFLRLFGRFAGNVALTFKATGGVYLAGGVGRGFGALFDAQIFRAAFETHPPHQRLLASIPTCLITYEQPGLLGCAAVAARLRDESMTAKRT